MSPISRDNEEAVCRSMVDGCMQALGAYCSTVDQDLGLLQSTNLTAQQRMAIELRLGEKQTLDTCMGYFDRRMQELDSIEYYAEARLKSLGLLDDNGNRPTFDDMINSGIA